MRAEGITRECPDRTTAGGNAARGRWGRTGETARAAWLAVRPTKEVAGGAREIDGRARRPDRPDPISDRTAQPAIGPTVAADRGHAAAAAKRDHRRCHAERVDADAAVVSIQQRGADSDERRALDEVPLHLARAAGADLSAVRTQPVPVRAAIRRIPPLPYRHGPRRAVRLRGLRG